MKRLLEIPEVLNDVERINKKGQAGLDIAMEKGHTEVADTIRAITQLHHPGNHLIPWRHEKKIMLFLHCQNGETQSLKYLQNELFHFSWQ